MKKSSDRKCKYLLWNIKDILDIANGSGKIKISDTFFVKFEKELTFSQLYGILKANKEYSFKKNIPQSSCLCEICENTTLLARGLNKALETSLPTNPHDVVEKYTCNLSTTTCALNCCGICFSETFDFGPRKCNSNEESSNSEDDHEDDEVKYCSWAKKITKEVFRLF